MNRLNQLKTRLIQTQPLLPLAAFRMFFGAIMLFHSSKLLDRVSAYAQSDGLVFHFEGLAFWSLLSVGVLESIVYLSFAAAVLVMLGWKFRLGSIIWGLVSLYFLLADQLYYNNHYYLFTLLAFLLPFTDADRQWSLRVRLRSADQQIAVPYWQYLLLQLQLVIVYFYGALAKLTPDWLSGLVTADAVEATFGNGILATLSAAVLNYGGLVFDLSIGFLLLYRPTRLLALLGVLFFNLFNGWFFDDIGVFPLAMLVATFLMFWPSEWLPLSNTKKAKQKKGTKSTKVIALPPRLWQYVLLAYFTFQLLFPLRHLFVPNSPEWTGQGHYFSWRMKSFRKDVTQLEFQLRMQGIEGPLASTDLGFDDYTRHRAAAMPAMVKQLASVAEKAYRAEGMNNFYITVNYQVAFNGHPAQAVIDQETNLLEVDYLPLKPNDWILEQQK